jgi:hypothetical protein
MSENEAVPGTSGNRQSSGLSCFTKTSLYKWTRLRQSLRGSRTTKSHGHRIYKAYVVFFVCFVTRALQLELDSDLTTSAFIAAFRRFKSRRSLCRIVTMQPLLKVSINTRIMAVSGKPRLNR